MASNLPPPRSLLSRHLSVLLTLIMGAGALVTAAAAFQEVQQKSGEDKLFKPPGEELSEDLKRELAHVDPLLGGWDSEAQQGAAKTAIEAFLKSAYEQGARKQEQFGDLWSKSFAGSTELRPAQLTKTYDDGATRAYQADEIVNERRPAVKLANSLEELCAPFDGDGHPRLILKVITSDNFGERGLRTEVLIQVDGQAGDDRLQQNFTWLVTWQLAEQEQVLLSAIDLLEYSEVYTPHNIFSEVTQAILGGLPYYESQLLSGVDDRVDRYDLIGGGAFLGSHGITVADINGDGYDDIYICQEGGISNRLLLHNPDGSVTDISRKSGAGVLDGTRSALILDIDGDGDQDLALAIHSNILLLYNDGALNFSESQWLVDDAHSDIFSLAAADPDKDGDLDIYACRHMRMGSLGASPVPFFDANNGSPNLYWRNEGERKFSSAIDEVGLGENNSKFSFAAVWDDFDGDGDLDLFVANDFGRNNLYRNDGGKFKDVGAEAGIAESAASMGITTADFDLDGDVDLLVSNMFSAAGRRTVSHAEKFMERQLPETQANFARIARGNSLFSNRGDGTFEDLTETAGIEMGRWSWGSRAIDFNNDGYEDMYVPNGFVTNTAKDDL